MYLIVGLGNPGKQYEATRHNVGFVAVDEIAKELDISVDKLKFKSLIGEGRIGSEKVIIAKPQTFMNLSGQAVLELVNFYKVDISNLIVIYDDIDLDAGKIRIRKSGSAGTHNGMRSIIELLGKTDFPRVRIGVSRPKNGQDLANFVLGKFEKTEIDEITAAIKKSEKAVIETVKSNLDKAMNLYNK